MKVCGFNKILTLQKTHCYFSHIFLLKINLYTKKLL